MNADSAADSPGNSGRDSGADSGPDSGADSGADSGVGLQPPELKLVDLEDALIDGLGEHLPDLEILDRALVLSGGAEGRSLRADLVAIDACGRLVLILLVDGSADETVFVGLESLALVRSSRSLLAQHLRSSRVSDEAPSLVVLVAEAFSARVLRTLAAVSPRELRLYEVRELSSAKGLRSTFVPVNLTRISAHGNLAPSSALAHAARGSRREDRAHVSAGDPIPTRSSGFAPAELARAEFEREESARGADMRAPRMESSPFAAPCLGDFLELLPLAVRPTAELCCERIGRIDVDLDPRFGFDAVAWRYHQHNLCSVTWTGARLVGVVASAGAAIDLWRARDVDTFVDRAVGEHLRRLAREEYGPGERSEDAPGSGERSGLEAHAGVLLTPEEIAAFRD